MKKKDYVIEKVKVEKGQHGYVADVFFSFYTERQFTNEEHICQIVKCESYEKCLKQIKETLGVFVQNNRHPNWKQMRRKNGWT